MPQEMPQIDLCVPKPEHLVTEAEIDEHTRRLGEMLKAKVRTAKTLALAQAKDTKARKDLSEAKDDLRQLSVSLLGI